MQKMLLRTDRTAANTVGAQEQTLFFFKPFSLFPEDVAQHLCIRGLRLIRRRCQEPGYRWSWEAERTGQSRNCSHRAGWPSAELQLNVGDILLLFHPLANALIGNIKGNNCNIYVWSAWHNLHFSNSAL